MGWWNDIENGQQKEESRQVEGGGAMSYQKAEAKIADFKGWQREALWCKFL